MQAGWLAYPVGARPLLKAIIYAELQGLSHEQEWIYQIDSCPINNADIGLQTVGFNYTSAETTSPWARTRRNLIIVAHNAQGGIRTPSTSSLDPHLISHKIVGTFPLWTMK